MTFMESAAKSFLVKKAVREVMGEIEKAGIDNLKALAEAGKSIVSLYLQGCSTTEQARIRRDLNVLLTMGITVDMLIDEVTRQISELAPIIKNMAQYKRGEVEKLLAFLKEG